MKKLAPGPKGFTLLKSLLNLRDHTFEELKNLQGKYGDIIRVRIPGVVHLMSHPEHARHIFKTNSKNYLTRGIEFDEVKPFMGEGLFHSTGELWQRQRRTVGKEFHVETVKTFIPAIIEHTEKKIGQWSQAASNQKSLEMTDEMMSLTLAIAGNVFFGTQFEDAAFIGEAINFNGNLAADRVTALFKLPRRCPIPRHRKADKYIKQMNAIVYGMMANYEKNKSTASNVLSRLMKTRESDRQLRDEIVSLIVGGHETTAGVLYWTLYALSQNPEAKAKLIDEIAAVLGTQTPTLTDLDRLNYPRQVLLETMRLYPTIASLSKTALEDDEIQGYFVPKGSLINLCDYLTHRHKDFWDDPEKFDPERFTAKNIEARHPYAYYPFGKGPRACIGEHFAMVESQLILIMLLQKFDFVPVAGHAIVPKARITLVPKNGMPMNLFVR